MLVQSPLCRWVKQCHRSPRTWIPTHTEFRWVSARESHRTLLLPSAIFFRHSMLGSFIPVTVSMLDSGSTSLCLSPGKHCIVLLSKTLYSHSASALHLLPRCIWIPANLMLGVGGGSW